ncbi:hypothetical protein Cs7R123_50160 [Catellatospora sp. TT07R-123]|uniref:TetR/AcrR family transcriptional regulator n=1 Tax=Catellatospora sp. TT07R-123 TaxID=2733863 RepID=UPI001B1BA821|nr:TetR/AcrR family transcriptional regulator [Catellatospora sp. TT07R-123]GHJ47674.1 hypothetical protein Cs7R123_50160 [Catellatospora sp. TT07R-123]
MPKLTDARRELRRDQIIQAAVRCFVRNGMDRTSVADITAESGLSAGSIYAHYRSKAEIVQAAAQDVLERRLRTLTAAADGAQPPSPAELITRLAAGVERDEARVGLQAWGEATTDPVIRDIVTDMTDRFRDQLQVSCAAWLVAARGREPGEARAGAAILASHLVDVYLAFLFRRALLDEAAPIDLRAITAFADAVA